MRHIHPRWTIAAIAALVIVSGSALADTTPTGAPQPEDIKTALGKAYHTGKKTTDGKNADYIPALAKVDSNLFGIALVTVDGKVYEIGDVSQTFSIQSIAKIFTAARAMDVMGPDEFEKKIGVSATGQPFNSIMAIEMNENHRAGNPLVNPGAIATVGLIPGATPEERWNQILGTMSAAAGRVLNVDQEVYKSESESNTRNQAISRLLEAYEVLSADPDQTLDLYTRECSVSVTARDLAVMGAMFANGGTNPLTGQRVIAPNVATRTLAVMETNGLYENSGVWAFRVGVPAKSGVGGGIIAVVPGRYAIGTFSPPLDKAGNSVRGQKAIASIVAELGGNVFASAPAPARPASASSAPVVVPERKK